MAAAAAVTGLPQPAWAAAAVDLVPVGSYAGSGATALARSEIVAFDPASRRAFTTNDGGSLTQIDIADLSNPAAPVLVATFDLSPYGDTVQSVATRNGVVAAAVAPADPLAKGAVVLFTTAGSLLGAVPTGYLPDSVTFTPDGTKVLSADEGQPSCSGSTVVDVPGSVTIIDVASLTSSTATFTAADVVPGVRVNLPTPDADELEPEYIAISPDSRTAYVTLQENNAIATVDIATADVTSVAPLGAKDHNVAGQGLDPSDRDNAAGTGGVIAIVNRPVLGLPMPDGIASLTQGATTYLLTANEGDAREYPPCFGRDDERLSSRTLDPSAFPNATTLKGNGPEGIGRLRVSRTDGDLGGDGDLDQLYSFGTRSMSVFLPDGTLVADTGDELEQTVKALYPAAFNSDGEGGGFDSRSPNKGPEPESVVVGQVGGVDLAFLGLERIGGVAVYDVSNPADPTLVDYANPKLEPGAQPGDGDAAPEGLAFVKASDSPNGIPLLLVANEVSGNTTIYEVRTLAPPATQTITGDFAGPVTVNAGQSVLITGARVVGPVTVNPGGALVVVNSQISRGITANEPAFFSLCGSQVSGPASTPGRGVVVTNSPVPLRIGDPANGCAANRVAGDVVLRGNSAGLTLGSNIVSGNVTVDTNAGTTVIKANTINRTLACSANSSVPTNAGQVNSAAAKTGQCAAL